MSAQQGQVPDLSQAEWQAVSIAIYDAANWGCIAPNKRPGLLGRLYVALTGNVPPRPLADSKLEAIRSFVCATRRRRKPATEYVAQLQAFGFNSRQVEALTLLSA
jgi:hypothetical protein